ncbi:MAG: hypothetical protein M1820_002476 [Bogoriella megaspora]|nr:MAG: hypothetical protein M1820_002476 [Bogoriella megaspora]
MQPQSPMRTIDISLFTSVHDISGREDAAKSLVEACHELGFVNIVGHGLPPEAIKEAFVWTQRLFDLSLEDKMKAPHPATQTPHRGYSGIGKEKVYSQKEASEADNRIDPRDSLRKIEDYKESYEIGSENDDQQPNIWLPNDVLPGFRKFMTDFYEKLTALADLLLEVFAIGLRLPEAEQTSLKGLNSRHYNQLRLLNYPTIEKERIEHDILARMPAHTDWGSFTILFQDAIGGLELQEAASKTFIDAEPQAGALVLNIGDMFQRFTNGTNAISNDNRHTRVDFPLTLDAGYFLSPSHRVRIPCKTGEQASIPRRISIPFFVMPDPKLVITPLTKFVSESRPAKYEPVRFRDYEKHVSRYQYND